MTKEELIDNRQALLNELNPAECKYIEKTWGPKENRVVHLYTHRYPNLGSTSSQRGESYHHVMREVTNAQLSLEDSAKRLCSKVKSILRDLVVDEQHSLRKYPRLAQAYAFTDLRYNISNFALNLLQQK